LIFSLIRRDDDLILVFAIQCVAWLVLLGLAAGALRRLGIVPLFPQWPLLLRLGRQSIDYFGSRAATSFYTTLPTLVVAFSGNTGQIALFAAAEKILRAMQLLSYPLIDAIYPWMIRFRDTAFFVKVAAAYMAAAAVGALLVAFFATDLLTACFGRGYEQGTLLLQVLMVVVPINAGAMIVGYPFLEAFGRGAVANRSVQIGAVFFACAIPFIMSIGSVSALVVAILILVTEGIVLAIRARAVMDIAGGFRVAGRE
jgi:PST family polysaccharide transporter